MVAFSSEPSVSNHTAWAAVSAFLYRPTPPPFPHLINPYAGLLGRRPRAQPCLSCDLSHRPAVPMPRTMLEPLMSSWRLSPATRAVLASWGVLCFLLICYGFNDYFGVLIEDVHAVQRCSIDGIVML